MPVETLRRQTVADLCEFAWEQWSLMGVSGASGRPERRAADPEALLLFTFEIARSEPRLFDEVLDWLLMNEPLISVQRLRNVCAGDADRALAEAALGCVARWRPRARLSGGATARAAGAEPLFRGLRRSIDPAEPAYARNGLLRGEFTPSRKSRAPDYSADINLAFRMRRLLGIGARAEVMRALITAQAPRLSTPVLAESAGFAQRNVREALAQLQDAGVVEAATVAGDRHYATDRGRWATLLRTTPDELPRPFDWIPALRALTAIVRWLHEPGRNDASPYLRASDARSLMNAIGDDLRYAGIPVDGADVPVADYWGAFERTVRGAVAQVRGGTSDPEPRPAGRQRRAAGREE